MRADNREVDSDASDSNPCSWDIPVKPERARQRKPKLSRATTIKKDKGAPSPRCAVVVEPASPSRDAGPPVRTTREVFKRLVATLDSVLPKDFRSVSQRPAPQRCRRALSGQCREILARRARRRRALCGSAPAQTGPAGHAEVPWRDYG